MCPIYFGTVDLHRQIHCQALGFTTQFYLFACAPSVHEAESLMATWAKSRGCEVKAVKAIDAINQDVTTYTFPHQIINIPIDVLEAEYDRRDYPASLRDPAHRIALQSERVQS